LCKKDFANTFHPHICVERLAGKLRIDGDESDIQLTSEEYGPTTANTGRMKG